MSDPIIDEVLEMESIEGDTILDMADAGGDEYQMSPQEQAVVGNYNDLYNKPKIEGVVLEGDKTFEDLTLKSLSNMEIEAILST